MREPCVVVPWRGWARIICAALLAAALAGCGVVQLAYKQAPSLAGWWINSYADLDDEQGPRTRDAVDAWFRWHRQTQLPDYADLLVRAQAQVMAPTTPAALCQWEGELLQRVDTAMAQAVQPMAELAVTLTPAQLRHIERRYERVNAEWRDDHLQPDAEKRREALLDRTVERVERLYGRLDATQRALVSRSLAASPFDPETLQRERLARQQDTLQTLRSLQADGHVVPAATAQPAVRGLMARWVRSPRPAYAAYMRRVNDYNCQWLAELHNGTTPAQRLQARERLRGWETDARALSRQ